MASDLAASALGGALIPGRPLPGTGLPKVFGNALLDLSGSVSNGSKTVNFGVAVAAVVDLTYQSDPACITGGTLEVKRVWTQVPEGASGSEFTNAGVKLTWSSCNTFVVARSQ